MKFRNGVELTLWMQVYVAAVTVGHPPVPYADAAVMNFRDRDPDVE